MIIMQQELPCEKFETGKKQENEISKRIRQSAQKKRPTPGSNLQASGRMSDVGGSHASSAFPFGNLPNFSIPGSALLVLSDSRMGDSRAAFGALAESRFQMLGVSGKASQKSRETSHSGVLYD